MFFEGNEEVFKRFFEKKRLLDAGDSHHSEIRTLLLGLGGAMSGVVGGAQVMELEHFGLSNAFDFLVGVSTFAPAGAYLLAGQSTIGTSIYLEECTTPRFLSFLPLRLDADYLANLFRGEEGKKALAQEKVHASRTEFYTAVTCAQTGEGILLNAKETSPDIVQAIRASIAIPGITGPAVKIGEREYLDGVGGHAFPIQEVIERFQPTDVLVLANAPCPTGPSRPADVAFRLLCREYSKGVRDAFGSGSVKFMEGLEWLRRERPCRSGIIWSDPVDGFERNPLTLRTVAEKAGQHISKLLSQANGSIS